MATILLKNKKVPKQARAKARVENIISSAEHLLVNYGPDAVSTTTIAKAADIPVGSIYQYFEDKDDIIMQLYHSAYGDIEASMAEKLDTLDLTLCFSEVIREILQAFWRAAKAHPSFRPLTRWANSKRSLWETTPGADSSLGKLIRKTLIIAGTELPQEKEAVVLSITVTIVSVLVDLAIEEQDEDKAAAILDVLVILLTKYYS